MLVDTGIQTRSRAVGRSSVLGPLRALSFGRLRRCAASHCLRKVLRVELPGTAIAPGLMRRAFVVPVDPIPYGAASVAEAGELMQLWEAVQSSQIS